MAFNNKPTGEMMIISIEQCERVQKKRVKSGKRGYSKAVRTFVRKLAVGNKGDMYREVMNSLPVNWLKKEKE